MIGAPHDGEDNAISERVFSRARELFVRALSGAGYDITLERDLDRWRWWYLRQHRDRPNPTLNPRINQLSNDETFWIGVSYFGDDADRAADQIDGLAATIACRLFVTDDYVALLRAGRLWYPRARNDPPDVCLEPLPIPIAGRIGHHGGLYLRRAHRGFGLPIALTRLTRAISCSIWRPHWHAGMIVQDPPPAKELARKYGYAWELPCVDGYSPARNAIGGTARMSMTLIDRSRMVHQARRDSVLLERYHGDDLRDVMAVLTQRTEHPKVSLREAVIDPYDPLY